MLDRLYYVFFQKPSKGKTERHLLGRFMTHGNNLRIIEDYHDQLADSLPEGPIDLHSLQLMDRLKQNPYIKVISQKEIDQDPEFAEFASDEKHPEAEPLETTGGSTFEYHQRGVATPQIIEFRGGVPHLNNAALSPEEIDAIKHNVMNGIGKIVHKPNLEKSVKKMEGVFKKLLKKDDDEEAPPHPDDVTEAFSFLRKLIETNPEAAKHERTLAKLIFKDSMVPKVGSKYAHQDFLSRPQEGTHVVLDGNDFKSINDAYGHPIGDVAIKARFGRIMREKLDAIPPIGGTHKLSMAMGFGQSIGDADKALYMAKEQKLHPETKQPLYPKGQAPTMAHSLMPGHEGPIPLSPEMPSMKVSGPKPPSLKMPEPSSTPNTTELNKSEELQKMAISSIPQGRRLFQKASGSQVYDYSHALTPKQRAAGYEMRVEHYPDNNLHVSIERHSRPVGFVHAAFSGDTIKPIQSEIEEPFRNQGLGTQAYEALLAHGFHHGAKSVAGGSHSTSASKVHQKLAERHGTEYNATPAPKEVRKKKVGPFDSRVGQYEYTLKSEVDLSKKILDPSSGYTISHVMDSPSHIRVLAHHGGKIIGALHLDRLQPGAQNISAFNVQVEPAHQRKGVASAMYAHAEKVTGLKIKPSSYQSRDGRQLWEGNEHTPQFGKSENNLINELHKYSSDTEEEHEAEELSKAFVSQYGGQLPNKDNSHASKNEWWHGSPSGKFPLNNIHVGSKQAAHEALTARIGHPVSGEWDGTREYGKTLLAGKNTLRAKGIPVTGYSNDAPDEDHFPSGRAKYSDGTQVDFSEKPAMFRVRIKGQMSDNWNTPRTDRAANAIMKRKGVKRGVYYVNEGEDVGSISAVVPAFDTHLEILDGKLAKEEELNKVTLTPDSVSNRMKPHQVYPD
ncbi:diguanylate cyclase, partial [bacterium]|nr:diguanylate cyclase [bacterium]